MDKMKKKMNSICDSFPKKTSIYSNCRLFEYLYMSIYERHKR